MASEQAMQIVTCTILLLAQVIILHALCQLRLILLQRCTIIISVKMQCRRVNIRLIENTINTGMPN